MRLRRPFLVLCREEIIFFTSLKGETFSHSYVSSKLVSRSIEEREKNIILYLDVSIRNKFVPNQSRIFAEHSKLIARSVPSVMLGSSKRLEALGACGPKHEF